VNRIQQIRESLQGRGLVWFGTRGIDALGLFPLARPTLVAAQIAPIPSGLLDDAHQDNLESRSRLRRDLDQYDVDHDPGVDAMGLKTEFLASIEAPVVLVAYRAAELLCRPSFCHPELVMAAPFYLLQQQFEYKPWVEQQLLKLGTVSVLRSAFIKDDDLQAVRKLLHNGPLVGRCSTGAGGSGVFPFTSEQEYLERLPNHADGFVGITPLLSMALPLNVNACVYESGEIAVFGISFQLVGIRGLTRRPFGFSGNDFAAASDLPEEICDQAETTAASVGRWLHRYGYRGVFGLDFLWNRDKLYVAEINPRFQASTPLSASINQAMDLPDPMTEHVAAFLGMHAPRRISTAEQTRLCAQACGRVHTVQVVHRNISTARLRATGIDASLLPQGAEICGLPEPTVYVDPEAMLFKSMHANAVTDDGYTVAEEVEQAKSAVAIAAY